ncbi:5'-3' exoribonuclease 1 [Myotis davidii]|uniref:5'-3' exoribonuclease 1 n=1 Tax=Myotis davidii TaxID=225400 RepID=L5M9A1_MYODS|nr:5'-3' exoribonuclease 1 [Myotis davidii]
MGVPKFYRWISERYPCLSEVVKEHQIPEFDNLYLDMNGIIHQCSHPNDDDVHFRISDDKIFTDIFHYLEVLFRIIKPRKVFFMAVDGVAPRAKMNQQRGRRFRSAKEAEDKIKKAIEKGETLPTEARFDSNCITPGYINENGYLNLPRFEKYLVKLSDFDREHFSEVFVDLKWFESKVGNKYLNEAAGVAAEEARNYKEKKKSKGQENSICWAALDKNREEAVTSKDHLEDETEEDDLFETEFRQYKRTYYMTKMGVDIVSEYYPYHYAPFLSDIRNISTLKIHFELGKPFMPFEQLLAVLPAASKNLLPTCYQHLMTSEDSPIIEYYPPDFKTDLNGKQQEWEAVVLIPFIDEKRLLEAMETCNHSLKKEERKRNQHSECLMCWYDRDTEFTYPSPWPEKFPAIERCRTRYKVISLDAWHVDISKNKITRVDQKALYFCGFPTLKHIKHKKSGVQVFQQSSRGENMMLEILVNAESDELSVENVASLVLGKSVFVNWPHLEEARVVGISDGETNYLRRKGIIINETSAVVYVQLLTGHRYQINQNGEVRLEKQWSKQVLPFVYQAVVKDIRAFDSRFSNIKTLDDLFPPRSMVFMLGTPYYGCAGEVQDSRDVITEGRIRVVFSIPCEPNLDALIQNQHKYSIKYNPGYVLASRLGVSGYLVSRFTGSIFIGRGSRRNAEKVQEIITWLKGHPVSTLSRSSCDLQILDAAVVEKIEEEVEKYKPLEQQHGVIPDRDAEFRLFDRVVNVREDFSVPVGLRGTVIGIKGANREADVLFEVLFDEEFPGGLTIRCSPGRGYRLPTSALVNLSYGSRSETGNQKLTAIVKPQPAVNHYSLNSSVSSGHLGGLNHSPQSLFVSTQVPTKDDDEFCNIWQSLQGSRKVQHFQPTLQEKTFGRPGKCNNTKLLKRNESTEVSENQKFRTGYPKTVDKPNTGFEDFLASLNISREKEAQSSHEEPPREEHWSPQSFAMKGTRMLKEILKIDGSGSVDHKNEMKQFGNEVIVSCNRRDEYGPSSQPKQNEKLTSYVNKPQSASEYHHVRSIDNVCWPASSQIPPVSTPVTELSKICSLIGMPQPDFSFLRTPQTMIVCQVKLPNGLLVHGPQCHSEEEAKDKAALFALQQLVTKKRVANKKNFENKDAQSSQATPLQTSQPGSSDVPKVIPQESSSAPFKSSQITQPASSFQVEAASQGHSISHHKSAPSSSSRKKSRKLAVNFGISKPSE